MSYKLHIKIPAITFWQCIKFFSILFFHRILPFILCNSKQYILPKAATATSDTTSTFAVSLKSDGSIYLGDTKTDLKALLTQASMEQKNNPYFAVIIRADKDIDYGRVITLIDKLKGSGITRFGLATDGADK